MKYLRPAAILLLLLAIAAHLAPASAGSGQLTGEGYGKTEKEAKKEALGDLSSAIQAEVQSEFKTIVSVIGKGNSEDVEQASRKITQIKSELPILGAEFAIFAVKDEILANASIDSGKVLRLYEEKLREIRREADSYLDILKGEISKESRYMALTELLTLINRYYKHKTVAVMLGGQDTSDLPVTEAAVREKLSLLEDKVASIDLAARLIAKGVKETGIYIYPPKTRDSHEVTQFASVVRNRLSSHLKTASAPPAADYFMKGSYEITGNGIELTYHLSDRNFNTLTTRVVSLLPESYAGYDVNPKSLDFDKLLHEGVVVSSSFRADVSTNAGRESLLFKKGEEIELLVKLNQAGYFYLVGHVDKDKERYSYIVEMQKGEGDRKFIYYVNADDANRWISLGRFETVAPFGVESLQVIASTKDLAGRLPSYRFTGDSELYIISENPEDGVVKTRALKKKIDDEARSAEAVLMFTTSER